QVVELALLDRDDEIALARGLGDAEGAAIETLVEQAESRVVREQNLHRVAAPAEEDEERTAADLTAEALLHQRAEPVEAPAQVDGVERDEDLHAVRDHGAPPRTSSTARRTSRSNPRRTASRATPTSMTMDVSAASAGCAVRTTRARRTCSAGAASTAADVG